VFAWLEAGQPSMYLAPEGGTPDEVALVPKGPISPGSWYRLQVRIAPRACGFTFL
jgi:hypothetical protein